MHSKDMTVLTRTVIVINTENIRQLRTSCGCQECSTQNADLPVEGYSRHHDYLFSCLV